VVESEALTLRHDDDFDAVFHLMKPNTLEIINAIWKFRNDTKTPVCFTLDEMSMFYIRKR
jgi:diphosphomevalonate decarboxylase